MDCEFENNDVQFRVPMLGIVAVARLIEFSANDYGVHDMITPNGDLVPFQPSMAPREDEMIWVVNLQNKFSIGRTIGAVANYVNKEADNLINS